mmetsp:Transcript_6794/g.13461  ORF Transcript_6794/g.13461 Transcript_6794/m.13461 type:complete len:275 (-) Transcript_6794:1484-2308(-)
MPSFWGLASLNPNDCVTSFTKWDPHKGTTIATSFWKRPVGRAKECPLPMVPTPPTWNPNKKKILKNSYCMDVYWCWVVEMWPLIAPGRPIVWGRVASRSVCDAIPHTFAPPRNKSRPPCRNKSMYCLTPCPSRYSFPNRILERFAPWNSTRRNKMSTASTPLMTTNSCVSSVTMSCRPLARKPIRPWPKPCNPLRTTSGTKSVSTTPRDRPWMTHACLREVTASDPIRKWRLPMMARSPHGVFIAFCKTCHPKTLKSQRRCRAIRPKLIMWTFP